MDYYRHVSDVCAVLYFIFGPLLQYNILVGSIVGGIYLGFCFNAGAPAVEAFIEKVSRRSNFEFGRARCLAVLAGRCVPHCRHHVHHQ